MPKVKSKQVKLTLLEQDADRLEKLSDNTVLSKSTLVKIMLNATLRDLRNNKESEVHYLLSAYCNIPVEKIIEGIYIY